MTGDRIVLNIENRIEDYTPIYPSYGKSYFRRDPWIKYLTPVLIFLVIAGIYFSVKTPRIPKEYGYTWTGVLVLSVFIGGRTWILADHDRDVRRSLEATIAKGPYVATLDQLGIQMQYAGNIEKIYWRNLSQLMLDERYLAFQDRDYNVLLMVPKGNITTEQWLEVHKFLLAVSDKRYAEAEQAKQAGAL